MIKLVGLTGTASFCVGWFAHEALADRRHARRRQRDIDAWYQELRRRRR